MPLYEFNGFTPEFVWEYGRPMNSLKDGDNYNFPAQDKFLLLVTEGQMHDMKKVMSTYDIQKIDEINMNASPNTHRERLHRNLFLISKN